MISIFDHRRRKCILTTIDSSVEKTVTVLTAYVYIENSTAIVDHLLKLFGTLLVSVFIYFVTIFRTGHKQI